MNCGICGACGKKPASKLKSKDKKKGSKKK